MFGATVGATAGALVSTQGALKRTVAAVRYSTLATGLMLLAMYPEVTTAMLRAIENSLTLTLLCTGGCSEARRQCIQKACCIKYRRNINTASVHLLHDTT